MEKKIKLVYVAGKYRSKWGFFGVAKNILRAWYYGRKVAKTGLFPVVPHGNTAFFDFGWPKISDDLILPACIEIMKRCDAVYVMPRYIESKGTMAEIDAAKKAGIPVFFTIEVLKRDMT